MTSDAVHSPPLERPSKVVVALVQATAYESKARNVEKTLARIGQAAAAGAQVIGLQELFAGLYPAQSEDYARFDDAEPIPGPTSEAIAQAAREHRVVIVGSFFERRTAGLYHNTAVIFDADGSTAGIYRKMHIPDDPLYYEKFFFTPGDLGFRSFDTHFGRVGTCVCWDQWYPEAARLTAMTGAQILFYPTAIGWHPREKAELGASQHSAWETMMRSHAIANGIFVAATNRTGVEGNLDFWALCSSPIPTAMCWPGHPTTRKKPCWSSWTWTGSTTCGPTGRFSAIDGSTRTAS